MKPATIIKRYLAKEFPSTAKRTDVEFDPSCSRARKGYAFRAKAKGARVKLRVFEASSDTIERAARAAHSIHHGRVTGTGLVASALAGKKVAG